MLESATPELMESHEIYVALKIVISFLSPILCRVARNYTSGENLINNLIAPSHQKAISVL